MHRLLKSCSIALGIVFLVGHVAACRQSTDESNPLTLAKVNAPNVVPFVGFLFEPGKPICSGALLKHGVFATAKHCFYNRKDSELSEDDRFHVVFDQTISNDVRPSGSVPIDRIELDGSGNDIAYAFYNPALTHDKIMIPEIPIFDGDLTAYKEQIGLFGYAKVDDGSWTKLMSSDCRATQRKGYLHPVAADPIVYDGLLFDSSCEAWFGMSGGPVYQLDEAGRPLSLLGVITHTFDRDAVGNVIKKNPVNDGLGDRSISTNYSPYTQASQINRIMGGGTDGSKSTENSAQKSFELGMRVVTEAGGPRNSSTIAVVAEVFGNSLAERSGFRVGDRIAYMDGVVITNDRQFGEMFDKFVASNAATLDFKIYRAAHGEKTVIIYRPSNHFVLGLTTYTEPGGPRGGGSHAIVKTVVSGSLAETLGFRVDDLIITMGGELVRTHEEFGRLFDAFVSSPKPDLVFSILRKGNGRMNITLPRSQVTQ